MAPSPNFIIPLLTQLIPAQLSELRSHVPPSGVCPYSLQRFHMAIALIVVLIPRQPVNIMRDVGWSSLFRVASPIGEIIPGTDMRLSVCCLHGRWTNGWLGGRASVSSYFILLTVKTAQIPLKWKQENIYIHTYTHTCMHIYTYIWHIHIHIHIYPIRYMSCEERQFTDSHGLGFCCFKIWIKNKEKTF